MSFTARLYDIPTSAPHAPRRRTRLNARVRNASTTTYHVVVHNLSPQGALIESYHPMTVDADVMLDIADLAAMTARVVWHEGAFYDCIFATPFAPDAVRAKLTRAKVVWANFPSRRSVLAGPGDTDHPFAFPELHAAPAPAVRDGFSPRSKLAIIVGSALVCWAIPLGLFFFLLFG